MDLQRLLMVSSRLPRSASRSPKPAEVVEAVADWVRGAGEHAKRLEDELSEILRDRVDTLELGRRLHFSAHLDPIQSTTIAPETDAIPALLMSRVRRSVESNPPAVVWLLAECGASGVEIREQIEANTAASSGPNSSDVATNWRLMNDGTNQLLHYPNSDATEFLLCLWWPTDQDGPEGEKGSVTSVMLPKKAYSQTLRWECRPWLDESEKNKLGKKFYATFEFSNLSGETIELTATPGGDCDECKEKTITVLVSNSNSRLEDTIPIVRPPILIPRDVPNPPQGPDPILIPNNFAVPGVELSQLQSVLDAFSRFNLALERSVPSIVRNTITPEQLRDSKALDHLFREAGERFEP